MTTHPALEPSWLRRSAWIFDLDGTLTVPQHDFAAMKRQLGLDLDQPLLEGLLSLPDGRRQEAFDAVAQWEVDLADDAIAAPGAIELVEKLVARGARVGVLTRNLTDIAVRTLSVIGLADVVGPVLGRDAADPKPSPAGIHHILDTWAAPASQGVMVGDSVMDIRAGRNAGVLSIRVGSACDEAHASVQSLTELLTG